MLFAHFCINWWEIRPLSRWLEIWVGPWEISCAPYALKDGLGRWCVYTRVDVRLRPEQMPQTRKPPFRAGQEMPLAKFGRWLLRRYSMRPLRMICAYHLRWPDGRVENRF